MQACPACSRRTPATLKLASLPGIFLGIFSIHTTLLLDSLALWRNGSASDSRSEGWGLESLWGHVILHGPAGSEIWHPSPVLPTLGQASKHAAWTMPAVRPQAWSRLLVGTCTSRHQPSCGRSSSGKSAAGFGDWTTLHMQLSRFMTGRRKSKSKSAII